MSPSFVMGLKSGLRFGNRTTVVARVTIGADLVVQCVLANLVMTVVFDGSWWWVGELENKSRDEEKRVKVARKKKMRTMVFTLKDIL